MLFTIKEEKERKSLCEKPYYPNSATQIKRDSHAFFKKQKIRLKNINAKPTRSIAPKKGGRCNTTALMATNEPLQKAASKKNHK